VGVLGEASGGLCRGIRAIGKIEKPEVQERGSQETGFQQRGWVESTKAPVLAFRKRPIMLSRFRGCVYGRYGGVYSREEFSQAHEQH
jgi:hypothetical protein